MPFGFGWIAPEPRFMERASHALATDGGVYVIDPVDVAGAEERTRELGEPAGVVQLLDRHGRDCRRFAERLGVPLYRVPFDAIPGSPFQVIRILATPFWKEVALWWPERRVLAVADAVGTPAYYRAPGEALGVSPLLRLLPPKRLSGLEPEHVLCGHGAGVHGPTASAALADAIGKARSRTPAWALGQVRRRLGR
jgi:glyoxylase-like metal-dependent hydrolase (beta-lactamase superfamily II)